MDPLLSFNQRRYEFPEEFAAKNGNDKTQKGDQELSNELSCLMDDILKKKEHLEKIKRIKQLIEENKSLMEIELKFDKDFAHQVDEIEKEKGLINEYTQYLGKLKAILADKRNEFNNSNSRTKIYVDQYLKQEPSSEAPKTNLFNLQDLINEVIKEENRAENEEINIIKQSLKDQLEKLNTEFQNKFQFTSNEARDDENDEN